MTQSVPRLHAVTNDDVLALPDFWERAQAIAAAGTVAIHLRSRNLRDRDVLDVAARLRMFVSCLIINDRLDIALIVGAHGVHLPEAGIPFAKARSVVRREMTIGLSTHSTVDAMAGLRSGADYAFLGPVWTTPSHPNRPPLSLDQIERMAGQRVIAIGGVTVDRVPDCVVAGAFGVAAIQALWYATDPRAAAEAMLVSFAA